MSWIRYGSVFALTIAFFVGAIGCSPEPPQEKAETAKVESEAEVMLAADEPPERSDEGQPEKAELDRGKPNGEVVEIPLDQIWAWKVPGTLDLRRLPAVRADERLIESMRRSLEPMRDHKQAQRGFAVLGTGDDALRSAYDVLVGGDDATERFPSGKELSAVFFTYQSPFYVHLAAVERTSFAIKISYRFVPHESGETTEHVALIPLGELPPGRYRVSVEPAPMEKKYTDRGFPPIPDSAGLQLVSRTFDFIVAE